LRVTAKSVTAHTNRTLRGLRRHALYRACRAGTRRRLAVVIALQIVVGVLAVIELQLVRQTVERLQAMGGLTSKGFAYLTVLVGLHLVGAFISALTLELRTPIAESIHRSVSLDVADTAAHVSLSQLEDPEFQNQLQRVVQHGQERIWGAVFGGISLLNVVVTTVAIGVALAVLAPIVLPAALLSAVPLWVAFHRNTRATHELSHQLTESDRRREYLERTLAGLGAAKEVRSFDLGPYFSQKIANEFDFRDVGVTAIMRARIRRTATSNLATAMCIAIGLGIVVVLSENKPLNTGVVAATALGLYQLLGRLRSIAAMTENLQAGRLFLHDYAEFLGVGRLPVGCDVGAISRFSDAPFVVDDVSYSYSNSSVAAVAGVSLRVDRGSFVAIVGDNGSGKSTLVKLMCGLLEPDSGSVRIGETPLTDFGHPLPPVVSVMFQDYVRYELSLRENVTLSDWKLGLDSSICTNTSGRLAPLGAAGLTQVVSALIHGDETILSRSYPDGAELSIGQWQRVALARALFREASILVLDEPTASLDALSEDALLQNLTILRRTRGIVLVTHRLSTARQADEIIVMDAGRVAERGSHERLMALDGIYAHRFRLQAQPYETAVE
jgi:ATP-binding cassette, subfamily B, bacterial